MVHDVFISYATEDKPVADTLCSSLEHDGIPCWIAPRDIAPGEKYATAIIQAIENAKIVVVVFSHNSDQSAHVRTEIERAFNHEKAIIPIRIENIKLSDEMQYFIGGRQGLDAFAGPYEGYARQLAQIIKSHLTSDVIVRGPQKSSSSSGINQYANYNITLDPNNETIKAGSSLRRSVAYIIDLGLAYIIFFILVLVLNIVMGVDNFNNIMYVNKDLTKFTVIGILFSFGCWLMATIFFLGYFDIFGSQRSPGKRLLSLKIVKFPSLSQSNTWKILRFLTKIIPAIVWMIGSSLINIQNAMGTFIMVIGFILQVIWLITMVITTKSQSVHDLIAGTTVISTKNKDFIAQ